MATDERLRGTSLYGPMPAEGTIKECWFCHMMVTLQTAPSGWHYWTAHGDPVDGKNHCYGGPRPLNRFDVKPMSLHLPMPTYAADGVTETERWYWRYTPTGEGRFA